MLDKIRKLQKERGWTTYKLALESGLTQSTLTNMFSRNTLPSFETLNKICDAFGITLSEFFATDDAISYLTSEERGAFRQIIENYHLKKRLLLNN